MAPIVWLAIPLGIMGAVVLGFAGWFLWIDLHQGVVERRSPKSDEGSDVELKQRRKHMIPMDKINAKLERNKEKERKRREKEDRRKRRKDAGKAHRNEDGRAAAGDGGAGTRRHGTTHRSIGKRYPSETRSSERKVLWNTSNSENSESMDYSNSGDDFGGSHSSFAFPHELTRKLKQLSGYA